MKPTLNAIYWYKFYVDEMEDHYWKNILLSSLHKALTEELLTDLVIITKDETIRAHKVVLAVASPYFRALLSANLEENQTNTLRLESVTGETMKTILNYIYCGKALLNEQNVTAILSLAEYFQIHDLKRICCIYIKRHLSASTYLPMYEMALLYQCEDLANHCFKCALKHCSEVMKESSFLHLQPETVIKLLREPILDIASEDEMFMASNNWLAYKEDRSRWMYEMLLHINEKLLNIAARRIYREKMEEISSEPSTDTFSLDMRGCSKKNLNSRHKKEEQLLIVFGGESSGRILGNAECFVMGYSSWRCSIPNNVVEERDLNLKEGCNVIPPMTHPRIYAAVTSGTENNVVCIIGGQSSSQSLSSCETYNISENKWQSLPELPVAIHGAAAAFEQNKLWVVGGKNSNGCGSSIMIFDQKRNSWIYKAPMGTGRTHFGIAASYDCLYAIGGWGIETRSGHLPGAMSTCEKYCIATDTWMPIASLVHRRAYHGVAVLGDAIYAIGGYNGSIWLDTVERYDPLENRWERMTSMIGARSSFGITVSNGRIYCMGGFNGSTTLNTVEKYNPSTDMWHCVQSMQLRRYGLVAATLTLPSEKLEPQKQYLFSNCVNERSDSSQAEGNCMKD